MNKETFKKEMKEKIGYAKFQVTDLRPVEIRNERLFDGIISAMKAANTVEELLESYWRYIQMCKVYKFYISDDVIIAALLSNEDKNKQFGITEDVMIEAYYNVISNEPRMTVDTIVPKKNETKTSPDAEPKKAKTVNLQAAVEKHDETKEKDKPKSSSPTIKGKYDNSKEFSMVDIKIKAVKDLESTIPSADGNILANVFAACKEANSAIYMINPSKLSKNEIAHLNDLTAYVNSVEVKAKARVEEIKKNGLKQGAAAHTMGGFNVNNFEKNPTPPTSGPATRPIPPSVRQAQAVAAEPVVNGAPVHDASKEHHHHKLPHEECGLTDEQIVEEVNKHFKILPGYTVTAYPLYDLLNNPLLRQRMKQYGSKQRPNNPFLTQIDLSTIALPEEDKEAFAKYTMAFTIPCKDKNSTIVVYYNPIPVIDKCGCATYPINIVKGKNENAK